MNMTRAILLALLTAAMVVGENSQSWAQSSPPEDDAVARVNGRPILRRDFNLAVQLRFGRRGPERRGLEDLRLIREQVLEALIEGEVLFQKASKAARPLPDSELDEELQKIKDSFQSEREFRDLIESSGVSEAEFREQIRRNLIVSRFVKDRILDKIEVSDREVREYYEQHQDEMHRPEGVRVSQIVVEVAPGATLAARAAARQKIEDILKELKEGRDFGEMARLHSDGPAAQRDGDAGYISRGGGALPPVEKTAFSLNPGEVSDIVETVRGFHIIKATDRRTAGKMSFEEAEEIIRVQIRTERREEEFREYVTRLKEKARIERLIGNGAEANQEGVGER